MEFWRFRSEIFTASTLNLFPSALDLIRFTLFVHGMTATDEVSLLWLRVTLWHYTDTVGSGSESGALLGVLEPLEFFPASTAEG